MNVSCDFRNTRLRDQETNADYYWSSKRAKHGAKVNLGPKSSWGQSQAGAKITYLRGWVTNAD